MDEEPRKTKLEYDASGKPIEIPVEEEPTGVVEDHAYKETSPASLEPADSAELPKPGLLDRLFRRRVDGRPRPRTPEEVAGPPPPPPSYLSIRFADPESINFIYDRKNVSPFQLAEVVRIFGVIADDEILAWHRDVKNRMAKLNAKRREEASRNRGKR